MRSTSICATSMPAPARFSPASSRRWPQTRLARCRPSTIAAAGITGRELIDEFGGGMVPGHALYAYLPGGASGGMLPASVAGIALDFDCLQPYDCFIGSAAVIILSQHDRARDAALNVMQF